MKTKSKKIDLLDRLILLCLLIIFLSAIAKANCNYYVNEYNHSKIRFETMQEVAAPYQITMNEKTKIIYYLENAKAYCKNKEYYEILLNFYKDKR